jgi:hypothetical protein
MMTMINVHSTYLEEEPSCIPCIKASIISTIVEVGDQSSMSKDSSELDDNVLGLIKKTCSQEEALKGDEGISTPASCETCRKMRKSCSNCVLMFIELG